MIGISQFSSDEQNRFPVSTFSQAAHVQKVRMFKQGCIYDIVGMKRLEHFQI